MGRQVEASLSEDEERALLLYMRAGTNVQIIRTFAPTQAGLLVDSFEPRGEGNWSYYLWNRSFDWQPQFSVTRTDPPASYVSNATVAPLLEYSRHTQHGPGRIYWAKNFSAPEGLTYDSSAFERWYNSVARWVKRLASGSAP
jgi:hypothetical protein